MDTSVSSAVAFVRGDVPAGTKPLTDEELFGLFTEAVEELDERLVLKDFIGSSKMHKGDLESLRTPLYGEQVHAKLGRRRMIYLSEYSFLEPYCDSWGEVVFYLTLDKKLLWVRKSRYWGSTWAEVNERNLQAPYERTVLRPGTLYMMLLKCLHLRVESNNSAMSTRLGRGRDAAEFLQEWWMRAETVYSATS